MKLPFVRELFYFFVFGGRHAQEVLFETRLDYVCKDGLGLVGVPCVKSGVNDAVKF